MRNRYSNGIYSCVLLKGVTIFNSCYLGCQRSRADEGFAQTTSIDLQTRLPVSRRMRRSPTLPHWEFWITQRASTTFWITSDLDFGPGTFGSYCSSVVLVAGKDQPDLLQRLNGFWAELESTSLYLLDPFAKTVWARERNFAISSSLAIFLQLL